jgi:antitoxin YefM
MITLTATTAKSKFLSLLRKSHELGEVFSVTNNGIPYAVIMSQQDYEGLLETIEILEDKTFAGELIRRMKSADKGNTVSFQKVAGRPQRK